MSLAIGNTVEFVQKVFSLLSIELLAFQPLVSPVSLSTALVRD